MHQRVADSTAHQCSTATHIPGVYHTMGLYTLDISVSSGGRVVWDLYLLGFTLEEFSSSSHIFLLWSFIAARERGERGGRERGEREGGERGGRERGGREGRERGVGDRGGREGGWQENDKN